MRLHLLLISLLFTSFLLKAQLPNYIPILVGDKYGFCDSNKNMLIEPEFEKVKFWGNKLFAYKNDKKFIVDLNSGEIKDDLYLYTPLFEYEVKKDSVYIFSKRKNAVVCRVPVKKAYSKEIRLEVVDTINEVFFLNYYKRNKYKTTDAVSKQGILLSFNRLNTHDYPIWKGFFVAKEDSLYSLYKITSKGLTKITNRNYAFLSPPNESGFLKAVIDSFTLRSYKGIIYNKKRNRIKKTKSIYKEYNYLTYIDTSAKEIIRKHDIISYGNEEDELDYNYGFYNYIARLPTLKTDSLNEFLIYGEKWVIFKDTLTDTWQKVYLPKDIWRNRPYPLPSLHQRTGNYLILCNSYISNGIFKSYCNLTDTKGKQILPKSYIELRKCDDSILYFDDSIAIGYITTSGKKIFKINKQQDSINYSSFMDTNKIISVYGYHKSGDTAKHIKQAYKWSESSFDTIDYYTYQQKLKRERDSLNVLQQANDTWWILRDKKVRINYNKETENYDVFCDEKLINPNMQIIHVDNHYDILFLMKSKSGHTWIYDNNGEVVYNTNKDYEYKVNYTATSTKINHFIITIKTKSKRRKTKFIASIHWPGFNQKPHYSELPIEGFLDSFTVVNTSWYNYSDKKRYGLYNKNGELIIHPLFNEFEYLKFTDTTNRYLFYVNNNTKKPGLLFDSKGSIVFDNIVYADFYQSYHTNSPQPNFFEIYLKIKRKPKLVMVDKYGTIYYKKEINK